MDNKKKMYQIEVWYRYNQGDDKDSEIFNIEANSIQDAVNIAADKFKGIMKIPFAFYYNDQKFKPNNFDKSIFN